LIKLLSWWRFLILKSSQPLDSESGDRWFGPAGYRKQSESESESESQLLYNPDLSESIISIQQVFQLLSYTKPDNQDIIGLVF
jgi:hypothetical protein